MGDATFTVEAVKDGYRCTWTLADADAKALVRRAQALLTWLRQNGFGPVAPEPQAQAEAAAPAPAKPAPLLPDGTPDPAWCPVHGVAMARRERDGQVWYSHKLPDGTYCKGKDKGNGRPAGA